jgi:hypothetical protein
VIIKVSPTEKGTSANKQQARAEYKIQEALYKVIPRHIPKVYGFSSCKLYTPVSSFSNRDTKSFDYQNQMVMYTEYAHGGTLKDWLRKMGGRITDKVMADIIRQVIGTLKRLHEKYPEFRHNDLHLGNLLIDDMGAKPRVMLTDFGLSRLTKTGSNPTVNNGRYANSGISSATSYKYDMHYFLNALDSEIRSGLPETKAFIRRVLPAGFIGSNTNKVKAFRIKLSTSNAGIPSFTQVLRDPFLSGRAGPRVRAAALNSPVFLTKTPESGGRNAADIASAALAGIAGVTVTNKKPSAAEFLKMSPASRAKYMTKTRGGENSRTIVRKNVVMTKGAPIVRNTARRVAVANRKYLVIPKAKGLRTPTSEEKRRTNSIERKKVVKDLVVNALHRVRTRRKRVAEGNAMSTPPKAPRKTTPVYRRRSPTPPRARARARESPKPLPNMSYKAKAKLKRTMTAARKNAKAAAGARAGPARMTPKQILNRYANLINNQRTITRRMLQTKLVQEGYSVSNANTHARAWERNWIASRANVNHATKALYNGANTGALTRRGYNPNVIRLAKQRWNMGLNKGTNGRPRITRVIKGKQSKALLSGLKKEELLALARKHKISVTVKMTKDQIVNALFG